MSHVIVICPCCASPVEVIPEDTEQDLTCGACEQRWVMVVDAEQLKRYALR